MLKDKGVDCMGKNPKRMTDCTRRYSSKILQRLQAYENIGTAEEFQKLAGHLKEAKETRETREKKKIKIFKNGTRYYKTNEKGRLLLQELREKNGLTQKQLGLCTIGKKSTINSVENGRTGMILEEWKRIAERLEFAVEVVG